MNHQEKHLAVAKSLVSLPLHLFLGFIAVSRTKERLHPGRMPFGWTRSDREVPHLTHHRRHHGQKPQRALFPVSPRHPKLHERLVGDMQKSGHVGLMLEHEHQLREILEAIQIVHREVVKKPALKRLQIDLVEQIVSDKLLRAGIIARMRIVLR